MARRSVILALFAALISVICVVVSVRVAPYANTIDAANWQGAPLPPCFKDASQCAGHIFGTDEVGRDMLARLFVGARVTIGLSLLALALEAAIAGALCFLLRTSSGARYAVDRLVQAVSCFPRWPFIVTVVIASMAIRGADPPWGNAPVLAAIVCWPRLFRAASSPMANWGALLAAAMYELGTLIVLLSTVDFLGWGVFPPTPSWGNMMNNLQATMQSAPWVAVLPALCIFLTVFTTDAIARSVEKAHTSRRRAAEQPAG